MPNRELKLKQASAVLGVRPKDLQNLVQSGVLRPRRVGAVYYFDRKALAGEVKQSFGDWQKAGAPMAKLAAPEANKGRRVLLVDKPDATQTYFRIGNVGIAKKEEVLFTRHRPEPVVLPENDPALLLIQRIRDEAHRFAVTFHRRARSMRDLRSELDAVPGIGPRRRRALLTAFGSLAGVRRATREELASVVGPKVAGVVIDYFARSA